MARGYNWSSCSPKMRTYFTLLNSDSVVFVCTEGLTAVALEHISEPRTSEALCDYLLFIFHREIQTHFLLTNTWTLYLQALQKTRSLWVALPCSGFTAYLRNHFLAWSNSVRIREQAGWLRETCALRLSLAAGAAVFSHPHWGKLQSLPKARSLQQHDMMLPAPQAWLQLVPLFSRWARPKLAHGTKLGPNLSSCVRYVSLVATSAEGDFIPQGKNRCFFSEYW